MHLTLASLAIWLAGLGARSKNLRSVLYVLMFAPLCISANAAFLTSITGRANSLNPTQDVQLTGCVYSTQSLRTDGCTFNAFVPSNSAGDEGATFAGVSNASVDAAGLHAIASESLTINFAAGYPLALSAETDVSFTDHLHLGASVPASGYLSLTLHTDGDVGSGGSAQSNLFVGLNGSCHIDNSGTCTVMQLVPFNAPIAIGGNLTAFANALVGGENGICCVFGTSSVSFANFGDTASISGISFADINGSPLDLSYITDSGFTYAAAAPAAVPEPETWALMLAGVSFGGVLLRRRIKVIGRRSPGPRRFRRRAVSRVANALAG